MPHLQSSPADFWSRVLVGHDDECWPWQGWTHPNGYGRIKYQGQSWRVHRLAYTLTYGPIPETLLVRHKVCDNRLCCNPLHLAVGTHADNVADKVARNRQARGPRKPFVHCGGGPGGEAHHAAILTETDVRAIRMLYATGEFSLGWLGQRFGVSKRAVLSVVKRTTWRHVV